MNDLLELAERCEQATGPDRELDCEIYNAIPDGQNRKAERLPMEKWGDRFDDGWRMMWADREDKYPEQLKRYTASLDAAMTLVPKGIGYRLHAPTSDAFGEALPGTFSVELWWVPAFPGKVGGTSKASMSLALCAAALRARAA